MIGATTTSSTTCSRAGCSADATTTVNWRNPKIHSADRVKVWLACDEHTAYLRDYLSTRNFPVVIAPIGVSVVSVPDTVPAVVGRP